MQIISQSKSGIGQITNQLDRHQREIPLLCTLRVLPRILGPCLPPELVHVHVEQPYSTDLRDEENYQRLTGTGVNTGKCGLCGLEELRNHQDITWVNSLLRALKFGFDISIDGPPKETFECKNLLLAKRMGNS